MNKLISAHKVFICELCIILWLYSGSWLNLCYIFLRILLLPVIKTHNWQNRIVLCKIFSESLDDTCFPM